MKINLTSKAPKTINQKFSFYTEELWKKDKKNHGNNIDSLFSGKKNETFISVENDSINFLIGLGEKPENFELQSVASKFSYDFRKKIQSENTKINAENFDAAQIFFLACRSEEKRSNDLSLQPQSG